MYGETAAQRRWTWSPHGLSPRVRGNPRAAVCRVRIEGSIPACTGKPPTLGPSPRLSSVYPRVYGETGASRVALAIRTGLSPRVRGNPEVSGIPVIVIRSIPACTGKPMSTMTRRSRSRVYPRVYGETSTAGRLAKLRQGLSSRVRGNPLLWQISCIVHGSIPACTGKPALLPML